MNWKRISSALLGFPVVLVILLIRNKYIVDICLAFIAYLSMNEYFNAVSKISNPVRWLGYVCCAAIAVIHLVPMECLRLVVTILPPLVFLVLFAQVIATDMKTSFKDICYTFFGIIYIVFFMMFIAFIDGMPDGAFLIWYAIIAAWGTDIFAYLIGKNFGKHHFTQISPNKTVEGCLGGLLGSVILLVAYNAICQSVFNIGYHYFYVILIALVLSILSQIGDLAASAIKRYTGIKDFSHLIPGHGGMLDRIDSIVFIAPFAYFLLMLL